MSHSGFKSITLLTTTGRGLPIVNKLYERGYRMVDLHHARGSFVGGPSKKNGEPVEGEQEIVTCVVESHDAENLFALMYEFGEVNRPDGGFMYMQNLVNSTVQVLPEKLKQAE